MAPLPAAPAISGAGRHAGGHGCGLVLFAASLAFVLGCFSMIQGIAAVADWQVFVAHATAAGSFLPCAGGLAWRA
jgi:hypothetical protein